MDTQVMQEDSEEKTNFQSTTPKLVINDRFLERQKLISGHTQNVPNFRNQS